MNWYKQAISEKDFYKFYAYSGLTEEDLKKNPVLLYEMIEHLNYIREYYLKYLVEEIGDELMHADTMIEFKNDEELEETRKYLRELRRDFCLSNSNIKSKLIKAKNIFSDYQWGKLYGGHLWAQTTIWTLELYEIGEIPQEKYSEGLFNRIYKLVMILDTIHSLEHNTDSLLIDLPKYEYKWMKVALEIVKNSSDFYDIAKLSKDMDLAKHFSRERMISQKTENENIEEIYVNNIVKFLKNFLSIESEEERGNIFRQIRGFIKRTDIKYFKYFVQAILKINLENSFQYTNLQILLTDWASKDMLLKWLAYILKDEDLFKKIISIYEKIDVKRLFLSMLLLIMKEKFAWNIPVDISQGVHNYLLYRNENYRELLKKYSSKINIE